MARQRDQENPDEDPFGPVDWRYDRNTAPPPAEPGQGWIWNGEMWTSAPLDSEEYIEFVQGTVPQSPDNPDGTHQAPYGLTYWQQQGVTPDQIFDFNTGDVRPGWQRSGTGYIRTDAPLGYETRPDHGPGGTPNTTGGPPPVQTGTGGPPPPSYNTGPFGTRAPSAAFDMGPAPTLRYPDYESAGPFTPRDSTFEYDPFSYEAFKPRDDTFEYEPFKARDDTFEFDPFSFEAFKPRDDTFEYEPFKADPFRQTGWDDVEAEPGYAASRALLKKQIEASAAHKGMVRSGNVIGDLYTNLDALSQQNIRGVDDRRRANYTTNLGAAFNTHQANLSAAQGKFDRELGADLSTYGTNRAGAESAWGMNLGAAQGKFDRELGADQFTYATNLDAARGKFDRELAADQQTYQTNLGTAKDAWGMNLGAEQGKFDRELGVDREIFDRRATDIDRANNYRFNVADAGFKDALARYQEMVRSLTQLSQPRD